MALLAEADERTAKWNRLLRIEAEGGIEFTKGLT